MLQVAALISEHSSAWRRGLQRVVGSWVLRRLGLREDWAAPAKLGFVYEDDLAHLPVHYIALGAPVSMRVPHSSARACFVPGSAFPACIRTYPTFCAGPRVGSTHAACLHSSCSDLSL